MLLHIKELGKYMSVLVVCMHLTPIHMYMYRHAHVLLADIMFVSLRSLVHQPVVTVVDTDHQLVDYLLRLSLLHIW
jgi:hypothetical protein